MEVLREESMDFVRVPSRPKVDTVKGTCCAFWFGKRDNIQTTVSTFQSIPVAVIDTTRTSDDMEECIVDSDGGRPVFPALEKRDYVRKAILLELHLIHDANSLPEQRKVGAVVERVVEREDSEEQRLIMAERREEHETGVDEAPVGDVS